MFVLPHFSRWAYEQSVNPQWACLAEAAPLTGGLRFDLSGPMRRSAKKPKRPLPLRPSCACKRCQAGWTNPPGRSKLVRQKLGEDEMKLRFVGWPQLAQSRLAVWRSLKNVPDNSS